ncbi:MULTISPECIES: cupin domain-containing protein [unclassified Streptomyces]|uniref:cupin domain-containing protein n=1 Tax=unclassified Streptomyces TaxID=2593676 RepID=UPI001BE94E57|nr:MULTISPECIES: cupin domain-containing protein [unclassified Streptomyces]MBT2406353.1 cupin domain-containing protein [Streptomyces sp. ISL-21]MBT2458737.1 cupin domain-containing protein [Streptomyces sp. ISL-86]MBT2607551.1 cupin domain-containing protein [Streptomyces sp. ISL-87]
MVTKIRIDQGSAAEEFGMACQRLIPWQGSAEEPPLGAMACFLPAGASSDPDCHDQDEVMIILSGSGTVSLKGEEDEPCTAGDLVVLPRNQEHIVHNPTDSVFTWVSVYWPLHERKAVSA